MTIRSQQHRGSIPLLRTTGSSISVFSGMTSESMDARLLSQATSTATMAARSVLEAGGSESTALKTARAAAKSILNLEDDSHTQASTFHVFRRRRSRRQAEVVASMALVSATNSVRHNSEWDILSGSQTSRDLQARTLQTHQDMRKIGPGSTYTTMGFTPTGSSSRGSVNRAPPESPSLFSTGTSSMGRPPVIPSTPKPRRLSLQTEPTIVERHSGANSTKASSRSNGNVSSGFTDEDSDKPTSIRVPAASSTAVDSLPTPEAPSARATPRRAYLSKIMAEQLSAEDPIYYRDFNNNGGSNVTREQPQSTPVGARGLHSQISSESDSFAESLFSAENEKAVNTPKNVEKNDTFISKPFELLSFGNFFACGGGGHDADKEIARQVESESDKEQSGTDGEQDEDDEDDDDEDDETNDTMSSVNSAAILRELNHSSDNEGADKYRRVDSSARKNAHIVNDNRAVNDTVHQNRDDSSLRIISVESRQGLEVPLSDLADDKGKPETCTMAPTVPVPAAASPSARRARKAWLLPGRKNRQRNEQL